MRTACIQIRFAYSWWETVELRKEHPVIGLKILVTREDETVTIMMNAKS